MAPATVACQYKTGRTLGQGTYAVVKEAVHITTGEYFACKVINKRLMQGREHMVKNEINVLKRVSRGHPNIVTLHDYFETMNNLYLVTDLCTGGELFDRICAKGSYYERDARHLIQTILSGVEYLHSHGIVHRDLKPENLLFKNKEEDSDLLIADFGLSKVVDDTKFSVLTTTCGTPSYMAPEVLLRQGHGKAVDIWAVGVITYFLLCGYTPFDRESPVDEVQAICKADYRFEPPEYWQDVSDTARSFITACLTISAEARLTAPQALSHPWLAEEGAASDKKTADGDTPNLLFQMRRQFDAQRTFRGAIAAVRASNRFRKIAHSAAPLTAAEEDLVKEIEQAKRQATEEVTVGEVLANDGQSQPSEKMEVDEVAVQQPSDKMEGDQVPAKS